MKKYFIALVLIVLFQNVFSQNRQCTSSIPEWYDYAKNFVLLDNQKDTLISFGKNGIVSKIKNEPENYNLDKRRKILSDADGKIIASYKNGEITFPSQNIVVEEQHTKNGWQYFYKSTKILEVNYTYDKENKYYHITANVEKFDTTTINLLQFSLGKFQKRVTMIYDGETLAETALSSVFSALFLTVLYSII